MHLAHEKTGLRRIHINQASAGAEEALASKQQADSPGATMWNQEQDFTPFYCHINSDVCNSL